ncbi:MAG: biotin synthase BioB [Chitinispirillia bacterium]|nr:biotin synthase BioB [Chitinispirillia bacterium]
MTNYFQASERLYNIALAGGISAEDMRAVAGWPLDRVTLLFAAADQVRQHFYSDGVDPCTLMNIKSGGCGEDCAFCTQSAHNSADVAVRGLADPAEIVRNCREAWARGLPFCVVSSGRKLGAEEFGAVVRALKDCGDGGEKHASLGILGDDEFKALRGAGVVCYNHNVETSRSFFGNIVTTHSYDDRVGTVKRAKAAGLKVCCGGIFGMGESWEQRVEMCIDLRELGVDTVPINFLDAVPGTRVKPLEESPLELLKIVSLFRLSIPRATIKVCGGREKNLGSLQALIFHAGANGYITGGYLTTPGAGIDEDDKMINSLGLERRKI